MKQELLIALINKLVKSEIENADKSNLRGPRGLRGPHGKSFVFDDYENEISEIIKNHIDSKSDDLKLKFSDLTEEEIDSISLKVSNLDKDEINLIRGPRGQRGKSGKDFSFDEEKENIENIISLYIEKIKDTLKFKKEDFSQDDLASFKGDKGEKGERGPRGLRGERGAKGENGKDGLDGKDGAQGEKGERGPRGLRGERGPKGEDGKDGLDGKDGAQGEKGERGPRGLRGQIGKGFVLNEHKVEIDNTIINYFEKVKNQLALKFEDLSVRQVDELRLKFESLTDEQKEELRGRRGPRGQKGAPGKSGLSAFEIWKSIYNSDGTEEDFLRSLVGRRGIDGLDGLNGKNGKDGRDGVNGTDGKDAPFVVDIQLKSKGQNIWFEFTYSDGLQISTQQIKIPISQNIIQQITSFGGSGGGGLSAIKIEQNGSEIGSVETLDFSEDFELNYDDTLKKVSIDYSSKIEVLDEGNYVSNQVNKINFVGDNVYVRKNNSIANWKKLSDINTMDEIIEDPSIVDVVVSAEGPPNTDTVPALNLKAIDSISLSAFVFATYRITIYNVSNSVGRSFNMTVNNYGGVLVDQIYGMSGSTIDYSIDSVNAGGNYELRITNNEAFELNVSFKKESF